MSSCLLVKAIHFVLLIFLFDGWWYAVSRRITSPAISFDHAEPTITTPKHFESNQFEVCPLRLDELYWG